MDKIDIAALKDSVKAVKRNQEEILFQTRKIYGEVEVRFANLEASAVCASMS